MSNSIHNALVQHSVISVDLIRIFLEFEEYAIFFITADGKIESWNKGARSIFGYGADEIISKNLSQLFEFGNYEAELNMTLLHNAQQKGKHVTETYLQKKNAEAFFAHISLTSAFNNDGSLKGFAVIIRDITDQKRLHEENSVLNEKLEEKVAQRTKELAVVNKELESFSYSVSHDLRTPLRAISGYSDILKEDYEHLLDAEGVRILNNIISSSKMMGRLIDDLLSFSKMSRLEMMYDSVSMNRLVNISLKETMIGRDVSQYSIIINELPSCKGDPSMLKQVWNNLIDNAVKYSSKKTTPMIEIGAIDDNGTPVYYIKDNGTGFDMKYSEKLFGVFQRLHRQDEFEGTGLGLALVKRIISKHGGEIWAEASLHQGATFFFTLPKVISIL